MRMVRVREKVFRNRSGLDFNVSFVDCTSVFVKSVLATMVALFLYDNKLDQRRRRRKENGKNVIGFYLQNNKFARVSRYFVQLFAVVAPLRHENS